MAKSIVTVGSIPERRKVGGTAATDFKYSFEETFPKVGMVTTAFHWSDRSVYDIIAISKSGSKLTLRERKPIMVTKPELVPGGFCAVVKTDATWRTESDPTGHVTTANFSAKHGRFRTKGGSWLALDHDSYHYDYSF